MYATFCLCFMYEFMKCKKASLSCLALNKCGLMNIVLAVGLRKVENHWSSLLYIFT